MPSGRHPSVGIGVGADARCLVATPESHTLPGSPRLSGLSTGRHDTQRLIRKAYARYSEWTAALGTLADAGLGDVLRLRSSQHGSGQPGGS